MVNDRTKKVLDAAIALDTDERALLAAALQASLDESTLDEAATLDDRELQLAWAAWVEERANRLLAEGRAGNYAAEVVARLPQARPGPGDLN